MTSSHARLRRADRERRVPDDPVAVAGGVPGVARIEQSDAPVLGRGRGQQPPQRVAPTRVGGADRVRPPVHDRPDRPGVLGDRRGVVQVVRQVGGDHDQRAREAGAQRDDGGHVPGEVRTDDQRAQSPPVGEHPLQERDLHLEAVLRGVGVVGGHHGVDARPQVVSQVRVERDVTEWRAPRGRRAHADPVHRDVVGRAEQDDPVDQRRIDRGEGEAGCGSGVDVPGVWDDHRHELALRRRGLAGPAGTTPRNRSPFPRDHRLARVGQVAVHALGQAVGPAGVEPPGDRGLADPAVVPDGLPPEPHDPVPQPAARTRAATGPGPTSTAPTTGPQRGRISPTPRPRRSAPAAAGDPMTPPGRRTPPRSACRTRGSVRRRGAGRRGRRTSRAR